MILASFVACWVANNSELLNDTPYHSKECMFRKKKQSTELQRWHVYLILAVLFIASVLYVIQKIRGVELVESNDEELFCAITGGTWDSEQGLCSKES